MNGIYGNMLASFQALFIDLNYFDMLPKVNSSFDITKDRDGQTVIPIIIRGCFQNMTANQGKDANGNYIRVKSGNLWTDTELSLGKFVQDVDLIVYRLKGENGWNKEGGFWYYDCEQVVGDDGRLTVDPDFNTGEGEYV
jgi:hypothetical protein